MRSSNLVALMFVACAVCVCIGVAGCQDPSVKQAISAHDQERSTYDQNFDLQRRMNRKSAYDVAASSMSNAEDKAALAAYAETRDKIEFLAEQNERTKAMGYIGVDTVLYSKQGNLYLLVKQFAEGGKNTVTSFERIKAAAATQPATSK